MMKAIKKMIRNPYFWYTITGVIVLIVIIVFLKEIKSFFVSLFAKDKVPKSNNVKVASAIEVLDDALEKFGTFNKDHEPIFVVLKKLSKSELKKLHQDFGYRLYNPITRTYKLVETFGWRGYTVRKDLNGLFSSELDASQKKELKYIYKSKGLPFPYLAG